MAVGNDGSQENGRGVWCNAIHDDGLYVCVSAHVTTNKRPLYLLHEDQQRFTVVLPLLWQLSLMGEFVAAHKHGQLKAVCMQVAKVIHTCQLRRTIFSQLFN